MNKKNVFFALALFGASFVNADSKPAEESTSNQSTDATVKQAFYRVFYNTLKANPVTCAACFFAGGLTVAAVKVLADQATEEETDEDDNN